MIIKGLAVYTFIVNFIVFIMCFKEKSTKGKVNVMSIAFMVMPVMILSLAIILK